MFYEISANAKAWESSRPDKRLVPYFEKIEKTVLRKCGCSCTNKMPEWKDDREEVAVNPRFDVSLDEKGLEKAAKAMARRCSANLLKQSTKLKRAGFGTISGMQVLPADVAWPASEQCFGYVLYFVMQK